VNRGPAQRIGPLVSRPDCRIATLPVAERHETSYDTDYRDILSFGGRIVPGSLSERRATIGTGSRDIADSGENG